MYPCTFCCSCLWCRVASQKPKTKMEFPRKNVRSIRCMHVLMFFHDVAANQFYQTQLHAHSDSVWFRLAFVCMRQCWSESGLVTPAVSPSPQGQSPSPSPSGQSPSPSGVSLSPLDQSLSPSPLDQSPSLSPVGPSPSPWVRIHESNNWKVIYFNPTLMIFAELCIDNW